MPPPLPSPFPLPIISEVVHNMCGCITDMINSIFNTPPAPPKKLDIWGQWENRTELCSKLCFTASFTWWQRSVDQCEALYCVFGEFCVFCVALWQKKKKTCETTRFENFHLFFTEGLQEKLAYSCTRAGLALLQTFVPLDSKVPVSILCWCSFVGTSN